MYPPKDVTIITIMIPTFFPLDFFCVRYSLTLRDIGCRIIQQPIASERQSAGAGTTAGTPLAGYSGTEERDGIPDSR